jgi:hypothetical protein
MALYNNFTVTDSKVSVNWMYEGYDGPSSTDSTGHLIQGQSGIADSPAVSPAICGIMRSAEGYGSGMPVQEQMEKDRPAGIILLVLH